MSQKRKIMDYQFSLRSGSRHDRCPNCEKLTFKPYIDHNKKEVGEKYGRCERVNSCGYSLYPKSDKSDDWTPPPPPPPPKPTEYISKELVEATFNDFKSNVFFQYLVKTFGGAAAMELQEKYNIGTARHGGTIFWQQDKQGRFRTGKVIDYQQNGKRDKSKFSWFIHKKIRPDFEFKQCFFGLHLDDGAKEVALCESEKTAIMMSIYEPKFNWIATGGSEMINVSRISELSRLDAVFPDGGMFEKWTNKTKLFNPIVDLTVELACLRGTIPEGSDILDLTQYNHDKKD